MSLAYNASSKICTAVLLGMLGFWINFQNIQLIEMPHFKVSILAGLYFPLLVAIAWGWRYGLISALAGGCQSMWWLWYSNGWGFIYAVPVFTLWITWQGFWSDYRRHQASPPWYLSSFAIEIPFRVLMELGFYTIFRRLATLNPPPWDLKLTTTHVPLSWCHTIAVKHTIAAYILLLAVYVTLSLGPVRRLFGLSRKTAQQDVNTVYAGAALTGIVLIALDGVISYIFHPMAEKSIWDWIILDVESHSIFMRSCYILIMIFGAIFLSRLIQHRTKLNERLIHLNRVLRSIRDINKLIITEKNKDKLLQGICRTFTKARGYHRALISSMRDGRPGLPCFHAGFDRKFSGFKEYIESGEIPFCIEKSMETSSAYMEHMPCRECRGCPLSEGTEKASMMAAPLVHGGMTFGCLCVVGPSAFFKDKDEQALFEEVAEDISFALWSIEMEKRNQMLEESYSRVLSASSDAIIATDMRGKIRLFSPGAEQLFGWRAEDIIGTSIARLYPDELQSEAREIIRKVQEKESLTGVETIRRASSGQNVPVEITLNLRRDRHGQPAGIFKIIRDITERKRARDLTTRLQQSQKMEAIGTLSGGIAHDFNNILFPIVGHTEMLLEDMPMDSPFRENLHEIHTSAMRAKALVKQILTFSRQGSDEVKLIKAQPIIAESLKLIRSTVPTTIQIKHDIKPDCGVIKADPIKIHQIIMNLITNAYHAIGSNHGKIWVRLDETELSQGDFPAFSLEPGRYLMLTVSDTGSGISPSILDRIFDPYFTTKEKGKGTGLGLSVIHGIVREYGGDIKVYSEVGEGTTFNVYIPLVKRSVEAEADEMIRVSPGGSEHILLVDDEEQIVQMEKTMLERLGYKVTCHCQSIDALEAFRKAPEAFDLVITDMTMPHMTGDQLAGELTAIKPDIPIIILTGFSERVNLKNAVNIGIRGFLMKPATKADMAVQIRRVLDEKSKLKAAP